MPNPPKARVLRFGVFEMNLAARELRKHGVRVRLSGQPFALMAMLLEKPGEVLTRDEMRQRLWAADTFVDFEHSLNSAIKKLRHALGDSAENSRYVETLPRVGYRFIAPVQEVRPLPTPEPEPAASVGEPVVPESAEALGRRGWRFGVLAGAVFVLLALSGGYFLRSRWHSRPPASKSRVLLAVLPFENLTGDPSQDYFSEGLTEEMTSRLARLNPDRLGVVARTSAKRYKDGGTQLQQMGRDLGVQYALVGSVRRDSGRVRIAAQLVNVKDLTPVWSQQYDRELGSLLALQAEIGVEIARGIQLSLSSPSQPVKPVAMSSESYAAYDLYLKGRYYLNKRSQEGFRQAASYFQQSIAKDPNYARSYAGLADTFGLMSTWYQAPPTEFMPKARAAALKALQLDDSLAEAHASLALISENYDYDWKTAEKEFRTSIELDPSYATAHQWYAECLSWQGHFDEALAESELARQLDPHSAIIAIDHAVILYYSGQYDRAIQQFLAAREMDPENTRIGSLIVFAYLQKGRFTEARSDLNQHYPKNQSGYWLLETCLDGYEGQLAPARRALAKAQRLIPPASPSPLPLLVPAFLSVGLKEEAVTSLERAFDQHSPYLTTLKADPVFAPLRGDPRFQDLLHRVGLVP